MSRKITVTVYYHGSASYSLDADGVAGNFAAEPTDEQNARFDAAITEADEAAQALETARAEAAELAAKRERIFAAAVGVLFALVTLLIRWAFHGVAMAGSLVGVLAPRVDTARQASVVPLASSVP